MASAKPRSEKHSTGPGEADVSEGGAPRKKGRYKKTVFRTPSHMFEAEDSWTSDEKEKLVQALKKFSSSDVGSIAKFVNSRTASQVKAKIDSIRASNNVAESYKIRKRTLRQAPLEQWISLVQELVSQEITDHSASLSKVVSLIGHNEKHKHSGNKNLNWGNIYQYISDLLMDRARPQPLTDVESLVVLDLMHNLGDALHSSDTEQQRRLLDLKYQMLRASQENKPGSEELLTRALTNNFAGVECEVVASSAASSSASSSLPGNSTWSHSDPSSSQAVSAQPTTSASGREEVIINPTLQSSSSIFSSSRSSSVADVWSPTTPSAPDLQSVSSRPSRMTVSSPVARIDAQSLLSMKMTSQENQNLSSDTGQTSAQSSTASCSTTSTSSGEIPSFTRPKYFTMNPLCIPFEFLDFKLKK